MRDTGILGANRRLELSRRKWFRSRCHRRAAHTNKISPSVACTTKNLSRLWINTAKVRSKLLAHALKDATHLLLCRVLRAAILGRQPVNLALNRAILRSCHRLIQTGKAAFQNAFQLLTLDLWKIRRPRKDAGDAFAKFRSGGNLRDHLSRAIKLLAKTLRNIRYRITPRRDICGEPLVDCVQRAVADSPVKTVPPTVPRTPNSRPEDWRALGKVLYRLTKPASSLT